MKISFKHQLKMRRIVSVIHMALFLLCFTNCKKDNQGVIKGGAVVPNFQTSDTVIEINQTVSYNDISIGSPTLLTWIFEGGNPVISHERNPNVLYEKAGVFDVKLIAQNDISIDSIIRKKYIVVENSLPVKFELVWQKSIGEFCKSEMVSSFIKTKDGGYMSSSWIWLSNENTDVSIVKYNSSLDIVWEKIFSGNYVDRVGSLIETSDGNFLIAGSTNSTAGDIISYHGDYDAFVLKFDDNGNILWQKSYGGSGSDGCESNSLIELSDSHFIISATCGSNDGDISSNHGGMDLWLVNLNKDGAIEWEKCYGGSMDEYGRQIILYGQNYVIGLKNNSTDGDFMKAGNFVAMINKDGVIQWKTNIGGMNYGKTIMDKNGGFISLYANNNRSSDFEVVKMNESGTIVWKSSFGGSKQEFGQDIAQLEDCSLVVLGLSSSNDGEIGANYGNDDDIIVAKLNVSGKLLCLKNFGGSMREWANCMINMGNGEYLINASTSSNDFDVLHNNGNTGIDNWLIRVHEMQIN